MTQGGSAADGDVSQCSSHVSYRNSKLTRMLQPSLSGDSKVSVICTMNPSAQACVQALLVGQPARLLTDLTAFHQHLGDQLDPQLCDRAQSRQAHGDAQGGRRGPARAHPAVPGRDRQSPRAARGEGGSQGQLAATLAPRRAEPHAVPVRPMAPSGFRARLTNCCPSLAVTGSATSPRSSSQASGSTKRRRLTPGLSARLRSTLMPRSLTYVYDSRPRCT
jgi:hypothetical protein